MSEKIKDIVLYESVIDKKLVLDFCELESWSDFETIAAILEIGFEAKFDKKVDGAESRVWEFLLEGTKLALINNPYGNSIYGDSVMERAAITIIFERWHSLLNKT